MIDERREEQASLYALGILPAEECGDFESALRSDAELRRLIEELRLTADALAAAAPLHTPPPALKEQLLQRIADYEAGASGTIRLADRDRNGLPIWLPWALAAALAVACVILWGQGNFLQQQTTDLREQLNDIQKRAESLRNQSELFRGQLALLEHEVVTLRDRDQFAQAKIAVLNSLLADSPKAVAVSVWDGEKQKGVLVVENLAPLPADKSYQLWVVDPAYPSPVDGGVFSVDEKGRVRFEFKPRAKVATADKFAISLEKKGGVPKAEGPIVMLSN